MDNDLVSDEVFICCLDERGLMTGFTQLLRQIKNPIKFASLQINFKLDTFNF